MSATTASTPTCRRQDAGDHHARRSRRAARRARRGAGRQPPRAQAPGREKARRRSLRPPKRPQDEDGGQGAEQPPPSRAKPRPKKRADKAAKITARRSSREVPRQSLSKSGVHRPRRQTVAHPYIKVPSRLRAQPLRPPGNSLEKTSPKHIPLPSKADILAFIGEHPGKAGTREIARAFGLKNDRPRRRSSACCASSPTKARSKRRRKKLHRAGALPDGHARRHHRPRQRRRADRRADRMGRGRPRPCPENPHRQPRASARPRRGRRRRRPRAAARRGKRRRGRRVRYRGRVIKIIDRPSIACSAFSARCRAAAGGSSRSTRSSSARSSRSRATPPKDAQDGDLVAVERAASGRFGLPRGAVEERLGSLKSERAVSMIAIHAHGIPHVFPRRALKRGRSGKARHDRRPRGLAQPAARHHRPGGCQGPRRRGSRRAGHRSEQ